MRIRLNGPVSEVDAAVGLLRQVFANVETAGPYPDRGRFDIRMYVNCDLPSDVPAQMLTLAGHLREQALQAAWPGGVDMPARLLQTGDQALTGHGWETVDELHIDNTAPHRSDAVSVYTTRFGDNEEPYPYHREAPIRVRRQPDEEGQ